MQLEIKRYCHNMKEEWDAFVKASRNGTFLFMRDYMNYHQDRYTDYSLMIYHDDILCALLPATLHTDDKVIKSHGGLTYGGLISDNTITAEKTLNIFSAILDFYREKNVAEKIIYRPVPHIYHRYPCEEELYALFRNNAKLTERKISSTIKLKDALPFKGRRKLTATTKSRLQILEDDCFEEFWNILTCRLVEKYNVAPVHTLDEIKLLHSHFPENIKLFRVISDNKTTLGGLVIYIMGNVVHIQYTGTTDEGRRIGVLDHLYSYLIKERFANYEYMDFGNSVEDGGRFLNSGLIAQKEGLGGRAVMYDTYELNI